jgi:Sec-independent protein translocase protein TatA
MLKILFWCLFIYFMYRLIFDLVIPVSRTASQFKRKVSEMQQQQQQAFQEQQRYQTSAAQPQPTNASTTAPKKDDYIEFEEVK